MLYEWEMTRRVRTIYLITVLVIISLGVCAFVLRGVHNDRAGESEVSDIPEVETETVEDAEPVSEPVEEIKMKLEPIQDLTPDSMNIVEDETIEETVEVVALEVVAEESEQEPQPEPIDISIDEDAATYLAKTVWGEARGCSTVEQAAVIWCILNRVDSELSYMPDDIVSVITQRDGEGYYHFRGYDANFPVTDELYELASDVLTRWELEKTGVEDVGRVLPKEYLYFHGDGVHNYFRDSYEGGNRWDWSLPNPYVD